MADFDTLLFNIDIDAGLTPHKGSLLVAEPFLREQYFHHSVIVLVEYEPQGAAMGVVLNNRIPSCTLQELLPSVSATEPIPVYCGGPMSGERLYFIHTLGDLIPESQEIMPGLYIGGDFDSVISIVNDNYPVDGHLRFFLGYSGWEKEQLNEELFRNVWALADVQSVDGILTGEDDAYWHRIVRSMGEDYRGWLYHPREPYAN